MCLRCIAKSSIQRHREDGPAEALQPAPPEAHRYTEPARDPMAKAVAFVKQILRETVTAVPPEPAS